jgi:hypothetical protein
MRGMVGEEHKVISLSRSNAGAAISRCATAALLLAFGVAAATAQQMSLPGNFAVNSNGAATYEIAIAVPPGTAGMVPSLKLAYSSQNGNGILGVGWTLSGLPSVSRCAQTLAQDGVRGAVTFAATDRFCMDGQRLVAINGSYGADGAEYRTEIDSYSRIISHGTTGTGPTWFEVNTKAGQIMQFGNSSDSLILAGNGTARNWALNKASDTKGNYFTVSYVNNLSSINNVPTSEAYPSRIDYTGNSNAGQAPYNSVQFVYAPSPRSDIINIYQAGTLVQTTKLLTDIKTYAGGGLVSDYQISYQPSQSTQASEMMSITVEAADGTSLPATQVNWLTGGTPGTFAEISNTNAFNGNSFIFGTGAYLLNGDFNGDGKTDFAYIEATPSENTTLFVFLSNGDGTFSSKTTQNAFNGLCIGANTSPNCPLYYTMIGDFNGDGLTDFALIAGNGDGVTSTILVSMSNGDGTFVLTTQIANFFYLSPANNTFYTSTGDFNGDGRTDFAVSRPVRPAPSI